MHGLSLLDALALVASSMAAGAVNAVAGGGTLLTFPTLLWLGLPPILANATSTVGLVPGSLAGAWGYREELADVRAWLPWILPASLAGGVVGAVLLLWTPPAVFDAMVPFLVLGATVLFALSEPLARRLAPTLAGAPPGPLRRWGVTFAQLLVATYGGYFGAGIGILMLAAFALLHLGSIHRANGLKTFAGAAINGIAAGIFIAKGFVHWPAALTMIGGSIAGGYLAARIARKLPQRPVRLFVVVVGLLATVALAAQRFG